MYNEAQKKSTMKYLDKLKEIRFRVKPEDYARYEAAAKAGGYDSMRQFYLAALDDLAARIEEESQGVCQNDS
ncbi:MAG: cag pathogenicity island protein [Clostridiales bacterium]|nr:cag pathogenicity island protein [Clostridiales bacterium]